MYLCGFPDRLTYLRTPEVEQALVGRAGCIGSRQLSLLMSVHAGINPQRVGIWVQVCGLHSQKGALRTPANMNEWKLLQIEISLF